MSSIILNTLLLFAHRRAYPLSRNEVKSVVEHSAPDNTALKHTPNEGWHERNPTTFNRGRR